MKFDNLKHPCKNNTKQLISSKAADSKMPKKVVKCIPPINKTENYSVSCPRRDAIEYIKIEIIIDFTNCSRDLKIF